MFYAIDPEQQRIEATPKASALCPACKTPVRAKCGKVVTWHWAHVERECDHFSEPMTAWHKAWQETVPEDCREVVIGPHRADILSPLGPVVELQHSSISVDEIREREEFYGQMVWVFDATAATNSEALAEAEVFNTKRKARREVLFEEHKTCEECAASYEQKVAEYRQLGWDGPYVAQALRSRYLHLVHAHTDALLYEEGLGRWWQEPDQRLSIRRERARTDSYATFRWKHPRKSIAACTRPVFLDLGEDELLRLGKIHPDAPCGGWGHLMQKAEFVSLINAQQVTA